MPRPTGLAIAVLGGGIAGLSAALALGRDGHQVTLLERDDLLVGAPLDSLGWRRPGIPHFQQPHAFTPRGRSEMRRTFPDVFDALIEAGAWDLDLVPKLRGEPAPGDDELVFLAVRRPLIEWALRRAARAEASVRFVDRTTVTGLATRAGSAGDPPRVVGVETSAGRIEADLVVDAMGRRSSVGTWVEAAGGGPTLVRSSDCAIIYYCRYYAVRGGAALPDSPFIPSPRGDLGYAAFSTFPGDNGTFCALVATPPADQELKVLRTAAAFEAAVATMPALHAWTNADTSEPITDVLPMGSLRNTIVEAPGPRPPAVGLIRIGDAICHTDPVASLGLSFALIHARLLADALREHGTDVEAAALAFDASARPEMEERYAYVSAIDDTRSRLWAGERIDYEHADGGAYPFFTYARTGIASLADPDVARALIRRNYFLDALAVVDDDPAMQARIEAFYTDLAAGAASRPRPGPPRDELIAMMSRAGGRTG
ncbi:MAG TPA: FAD-dependent oxidoreductase [Candidatus Limnocylindrales bacterium]